MVSKTESNYLVLQIGEGNGSPLQYFCQENPMDGGAWWAAVHGVTKSRTRLSEFTFIFHFHALEKEMATHSSVLAWRIPGMGELGGLPSVGSHRDRHDWSDLAVAVSETDDIQTLWSSHFLLESAPWRKYCVYEHKEIYSSSTVVFLETTRDRKQAKCPSIKEKKALAF